MPMIDSQRTNSGFTFVEVAMVMIIIGLLIGGVFGSIRLRENAQTMDIIKQLTLYEASAIKFKELYGELPGDIRDPTARLNNCNAAPCDRAGNGDAVVAGSAGFNQGSARTTLQIGEAFVFWNHLLSAGLISGIRGTDDFIYGQGQPGFDIGGGLIVAGNAPLRFLTSRLPEPRASGDINFIPCRIVSNIDIKLDDGRPFSSAANGASGRIYIDNTFSGCWDGVHPAGPAKEYVFNRDAGHGLGFVGSFYFATKIQ
jgi:prepilin-type N-terminal cleavage/methylation domain-containing protein